MDNYLCGCNPPLIKSFHAYERMYRAVNMEFEKKLLCFVHLAGQFMGLDLHRVRQNNPRRTDHASLAVLA